jgi:hypothetical protein
MNRNDFLNMMSDTVPLNRQLIGEVYELIDLFPYFQSAHLLLLKGLNSSTDVKFENQLRNSAIHIADREVLYYLLKKKTSVVAANAEIIPEKPPVTDILYDTQQTVIESAKNSTDLINEIENSSGDTKPAYESSSGEDSIFFMDPGFSVPEDNDLLELDLDENQEENNNEASDAFDLSDINDVISKKRLQSVLIDKFIIANPRIEPIREKSNLPLEEIHKHLVIEEGGFVTETLARIYISQEYYSKAIDIYEKLSLKFPEKSSYFASQIEKVKEYIKK